MSWSPNWSQASLSAEEPAGLQLHHSNSGTSLKGLARHFSCWWTILPSLLALLAPSHKWDFVQWPQIFLGTTKGISLTRQLKWNTGRERKPKNQLFWCFQSTLPLNEMGSASSRCYYVAKAIVKQRSVLADWGKAFLLGNTWFYLYLDCENISEILVPWFWYVLQ